MTPESCGGETSTSAYGNHRTASAAPRRSAHHNDALWYRVRRAPHLSHQTVLFSLYEGNEVGVQDSEAASSYLLGHDVLITRASNVYTSPSNSNTPSA